MAGTVRARGRDRAKLATYLLQSVIARHRDRWADIVLRTALWMREAPPEANLCWRELAIVAKALVDGRDVTGDRIDARYRIADDRGAWEREGGGTARLTPAGRRTKSQAVAGRAIEARSRCPHHSATAKQ